MVLNERNIFRIRFFKSWTCLNFQINLMSSPSHKNQRRLSISYHYAIITPCACRIYTSYKIFRIWMWYSFLKKKSPVAGWRQQGRIPPLRTFTFITQYLVSFIFAFKKQRSIFKASRKAEMQISPPPFCIQKQLLLKIITITAKTQAMERSPPQCNATI